jgi:hypothetical protein
MRRQMEVQANQIIVQRAKAQAQEVIWRQELQAEQQAENMAKTAYMNEEARRIREARTRSEEEATRVASEAQQRQEARTSGVASGMREQLEESLGSKLLAEARDMTMEEQAAEEEDGAGLGPQAGAAPIGGPAGAVPMAPAAGSPGGSDEINNPRSETNKTNMLFHRNMQMANGEKTRWAMHEDTDVARDRKAEALARLSAAEEATWTATPQTSPVSLARMVPGHPWEGTPAPYQPTVSRMTDNKMVLVEINLMYEFGLTFSDAEIEKATEVIVDFARAWKQWHRPAERVIEMLKQCNHMWCGRANRRGLLGVTALVVGRKILKDCELKMAEAAGFMGGGNVQVGGSMGSGLAGFMPGPEPPLPPPGGLPPPPRRERNADAA